MAFDNRNTGIIKRNDKGDNPQRPDYKGSVDVEGVQYWVAGWVRKRKEDGTPFLSIKLDRKEQQALPQQPAPAKDGAPQEASAEADERLPF